jgi:hypothetical protein
MLGFHDGINTLWREIPISMIAVCSYKNTTILDYARFGFEYRLSPDVVPSSLGRNRKNCRCRPIQIALPEMWNLGKMDESKGT